MLMELVGDHLLVKLMGGSSFHSPLVSKMENVISRGQRNIVLPKDQHISPKILSHFYAPISCMFVQTPREERHIICLYTTYYPRNS